MKISVRWLNEYLDPGNVSADEAQHVLTHVGFPIESADAVETSTGPDVCLDVEVTSNRGDVLSHIGVAREIAAATGRRLRLPPAGRVFEWGGPTPTPPPGLPSGPSDIGAVCAVDNRAKDPHGSVPGCALFTARAIMGVNVGPSPAWLVDALAAVGQRSINTVVDVTNFVAFEYGQPTHVFDLSTLQASADGKVRLVVRTAAPKEPLALLDGTEAVLVGDELVVADDGPHGPRAVSLAGVMGGALTQVTDRTTDVLLEAATWAPVAVRRAARRLQIRTDASYRFERTVDPRTIEVAARRAAALVVRLAGGRPVPGVIHAGLEPAAPTKVRLRPARCAAILGVDVPPPRIQQLLEPLDIAVTPEGTASSPSADAALTCAIPAHRPDVTREIDVIEEIARIQGLDKLPVLEKLPTRVEAPQPSEQAVRELGRTLVGLGFFETITFTFVSTKAARPFVPAGLRTLEVCDGRRKADPVVRPSALPSLLACRRANQDAGNAVGPGSEMELGLRLFEISSATAERPEADPKARGQVVERPTLALLADACFPAGAKSIEQKQACVRLMRGAIEACVLAVAGAGARVHLRAPTTPSLPAFDPAACAEVMLTDSGGTEHRLGVVGLMAPSVQGEYGLSVPVVAAELTMDVLVSLYPPRASARALPEFPSIERDLSLIVPESTPWERVDRLVRGAQLPLLEDVRFIGVYRGEQAGAGRKSLTLRMRFRDPRRTLTHDEVSPQMSAIIALGQRELGADVRTN